MNLPPVSQGAVAFAFPEGMLRGDFVKRNDIYPGGPDDADGLIHRIQEEKAKISQNQFYKL